MILLAFSAKDIAGKNIADKVIENCKFERTTEEFQEKPVFEAKINSYIVKLVTLREETVYAQTLPEQFPNPDMIIFLSRHSSTSGKPTLSVHTPGNFNAAELGGLPKTVSVCPANAMCAALKSLSRLRTEMQLDYEVSYECTHHGPSLDVPTMFVELGSSIDQWNDPKASKVVAEAAIEAIGSFEASNNNVVLGIGGPHYNQRFTQMAIKGEAIFGHMIPKYAIPSVTVEVLRQCAEKTMEETGMAVLDWKGIRGIDRSHVLEAIGEIGLPFKRI